MADDYEQEVEDDYDDAPIEGALDEEEGEIPIDVANLNKPSSDTQILLSHHPEIWVDYSDSVAKKLLKKDKRQIPVFVFSGR